MHVGAGSGVSSNLTIESEGAREKESRASGTSREPGDRTSAGRVVAGSIKMKSRTGYPLARFFFLLAIVVTLVVAMINVGGEVTSPIPLP